VPLFRRRPVPEHHSDSDSPDSDLVEKNVGGQLLEGVGVGPFVWGTVFFVRGLQGALFADGDAHLAVRPGSRRGIRWKRTFPASVFWENFVIIDEMLQ
jgi:hypothetical protein